LESDENDLLTENIMGLNNIAITRLPGGISNAAQDTIPGNMPFLNPTLFHQYMQDFDQFVAADWVVTETQAGATQALTSGDGGLILLTNSAADNDVNQIQKTPANVLMVAGKRTYVLAKAKLSDVSESDFAIGLQNVNVDGTDLAVATDGIFFLKADGSAALGVYCRKDNTTGTTSAAGVATLVNDTFVELELYYDGGDRLYYGINGTASGYLDASSTYFPNVILAPVISLKNGEAVAKTATVDYLFVAQER
jgi:hypothetical protein